MTTYAVEPLDERMVTARGIGQVKAVMMPYPQPQELAVCKDDPAWVVEGYEQNSTSHIVQEMIRRCKTCPLVIQCREWGIAHERHGVWGSTTAEDRRQIRKDRRQIVVDPQNAWVYDLGVDWHERQYTRQGDRG